MDKSTLRCGTKACAVICHFWIW